eukprot:TRINITY_DN548_c0_g2_i2.p1 TRINITY_DN548_c0_g2~~TRINITY_DN548_c0_g2_i2.p1  ORF type:complete len:286 (+),score=42.28 TRINITY_DN548_c0_g2_i2:34-858(+)
MKILLLLAVYIVCAKAQDGSICVSGVTSVTEAGNLSSLIEEVRPIIEERIGDLTVDEVIAQFPDVFNDAFIAFVVPKFEEDDDVPIVDLIFSTVRAFASTEDVGPAIQAALISDAGFISSMIFKMRENFNNSCFDDITGTTVQIFSNILNILDSSVLQGNLQNLVNASVSTITQISGDPDGSVSEALDELAQALSAAVRDDTLLSLLPSLQTPLGSIVDNVLQDAGVMEGDVDTAKIVEDIISRLEEVEELTDGQSLLDLIEEVVQGINTAIQP